MEFLQIITLPILKALCLTLILELLSLVIQREKNYKIYLICVEVNLVTNLTMNILLTKFWQYYSIILWVSEISVVFIEGAFYSFVYKKYLKGVKVAFICNLISFLIPYIFNL